MQLSIIIPIYNAEKFLVECLGSLKAINNRDIEFICVDDGSTDRSREIVDS